MLFGKLLKQRETYIGYPNNKKLDNRNLAPFLDLTINNVGDPFLGNNGMNTCQLETEVIGFFAELLHIRSSDYWGYVTNGGTEGNLFGLFQGREVHPDGIVYYSEESHYSVPKAVKLLGLKGVCVPTANSGEIDLVKFKTIAHSLRGFPAIINANIGTTMKGAIDRVDLLIEALKEAGIEKYYIHCDAALFGSILPFIQDAPVFDFRLPIGSIAISGHKFIGSPIPCGIVLTRKTGITKTARNVEYIGSYDSTISGSRDGFSVLVLWQQIARLGKEGLRKSVESCFEMTAYTLKKLREIEWYSWANRYSNIVVLKKPSDHLVKKWQLATENENSHVVLMPGVDESMIQSFIADLRNERGMAYDY